MLFCPLWQILFCLLAKFDQLLLYSLFTTEKPTVENLLAFVEQPVSVSCEDFQRLKIKPEDVGKVCQVEVLRLVCMHMVK